MPQSELKIAYKWIVKAAHKTDLEAIELLTGFDAGRFQAMGISDPVKWFLDGKLPPVPQVVRDMDDSDSFKWLQRAVELEDREAIYVMGLCHHEGYLVPQSDWLAFENFLLAAQRGWAKAQFKTGGCYATGTGTAINYPLAVHWYKSASKKGDDDARFALEWSFAKIGRVDQKEIAAAQLYQAKAEQGVAVAQNNLAGCYFLGLGVEPDFAQAARWCRSAAYQGQIEAQNNYGLCLVHGHGVQQDDAEAFDWFMMSAKRGFSEAEANVGSCYDRGAGVTQDFKLAAEWYLRAAKQGLAMGQCSIGNCYEKGDGVPKDLDQAMKWYLRAANQGLVDAQCNIAQCYEKGNGVPKDTDKALTWYIQAAAQGNEEAEFKVWQLSKGQIVFEK